MAEGERERKKRGMKSERERERGVKRRSKDTSVLNTCQDVVVLSLWLPTRE